MKKQITHSVEEIDKIRVDLHPNTKKKARKTERNFRLSLFFVASEPPINGRFLFQMIVELSQFLIQSAAFSDDK